MQGVPPGNKGTLVPGQTISVNKYTVVVERYLSQGGFAHVYLVRTATPVYNTTQHVLKRIAVPNEAMLSEVKKEVDIMRILKGHPNIVFLIDAAWHRMANGTYEVFILMEFCPGGGIIDMMNRRLRERLTEPEILTIFVEVCEGLAAMHALKPPILHRDLKVENILQSSSTSYRLCDFGSASPVQRVPTTMQEIRMLEADLNRHTTLQYRAPEMVDVHQRRPIDEKSDIWALGVLLYKLCYYTTPFEEHGPLAILNVQYKIPPYPVYSSNMNQLIASMLREHGVQRPTIFEVLTHVHNLRGTKSRFTYNVPAKEPLSPRGLQAAPLQALSPNVATANPLADLVTYKSSSPAKNAGVEARDKVLEAIAPMRRGRPQSQIASRGPSRPPSPEKPAAFQAKFGDAGDRAWKTFGDSKPPSSVGNGKADGDAWSVGSQKPSPSTNGEHRGFDNDFSKSFGNNFQPSKSQPTPTAFPAVKPSEKSTASGFGDAFDPSKLTSSARAPPSPRPPSRVQANKSTKDAFDGLGLSPAPQPQTLAEARKSRTGLASFHMPSSSTPSYGLPSSSLGGLGTSNTMYRPPSSHAPRPAPSPQPQPQSLTLSPIPPPNQSWRQHIKAPTSSQEGLTAEERFPALEDLDRTFASPLPNTPPEKPAAAVSDRIPLGGTSRTGAGYGGLSGPPASAVAGGPGRYDGVRSQQVTGTAMKDARQPASRQSHFLKHSEKLKQPMESDNAPPTSVAGSSVAHRPSLSRKHRSSVSMKTPITRESTETWPSDVTSRPQPSPRTEPKDWLTGNDDDNMGNSLAPPPGSQPVMRESPSKRASYTERSPIQIQKPLAAESYDYTPPAAASDLERAWLRGPEKAEERKTESKFSQQPMAGLGLQLPPLDSRAAARSTTPSPSALTDNWSPTKQRSYSSSSESGPEEPAGYRQAGDKLEQTRQERARQAASGQEGDKRRRARSKGRQSSVHDLVDLWGGGLAKEEDKSKVTAPSKRSSTLISSSGTMKPPPLTNVPRSTSPQPLAPQSTTDSQSSASRPLPQLPGHRKQPSFSMHAPRLPSSIRPIPSPAPDISSARSRPQSMFISPMSSATKPTFDMGPPSSTAEAAAAAQQNLSPPETPNPRRGVRRSSISDMVLHYEAIGAAKAKEPPPLSNKPAGLSVKTQQSIASAERSDIASPSSAATRFPRLSPSTSPVLSRANLAVPPDVGRSAVAGRDFAKHRTSPTGLPPRTSPVGGRFETPFSSGDGLPARRSPNEAARRTLEAPPSPRLERRQNSTEAPNVRSPSPEKPYQGVSKLIDKWERAVDDTAGGKRAATPARRAGMVASGSGRS